MPLMTEDLPKLADRSALRDRLRAQGARPHHRMSDLSRYMLARRDELQALLRDEGYGWTDLVGAILADDPTLRDATGKPITAQIARLTWSRLNVRARGGRVNRTAAGTVTPAAMTDTPEPTAVVPEPAADPAPPPVMAIRPATPRASHPGPARAAGPAQDMRPARDDAELDRRLAKLEHRQRPPGLKLPEVL